MKGKLSVSEVFTSIQGEGMSMGYPSIFLRLAGCNLMCGGLGTQFDQELHFNAKWRCDTIEVWMNGQAKSFESIFTDDQIQKLKNGWRLVITGGEPILQDAAIVSFIEYLRNKGVKPYIEVETNGTIMPTIDLFEYVDQWNCSPKLESSGNGLSLRYVPEVLKEISKHRAQFKFVIYSREDMAEIIENYPFIQKYQIWLMPAG